MERRTQEPHLIKCQSLFSGHYPEPVWIDQSSRTHLRPKLFHEAVWVIGPLMLHDVRDRNSNSPAFFSVLKEPARATSTFIMHCKQALASSAE